jgi:hypothetical protein
MDRTPVEGASLIVDSKVVANSPSANDIGDAILALEPDSFLIVELGPETYMQTLLKYDRFVLEKREGSRDRHFRAEGDLEAEEVIRAMTAYLQGKQPSQNVEWKQVRI